MQITLLATAALHVLAGVFWAGSTFALARTGAVSADRLFGPQMGAAAVAVITGGLLWYLLHPSGFEGRILGLGALAAVLAAAAQGGLCGPALRLRDGSGGTRAQARLALGLRIAAALLALTVICMAAARYA